MSILIKGMEMPKNCYDCPFAMQDYTTLFGKNLSRTRNSYACVITHKAITSTKRNRFCPLVNIPPHGRLIDADDLIDEMRLAWEYDEITNAEWTGIREWLNHAPTIVPAEGGGKDG